MGKRKPKSVRTYEINLHCENGTSERMIIKDSIDNIINTFLDKIHNGSKVRCVEFINHPGKEVFGSTQRLKRVYSISIKSMERYGLCNKFRFTSYNSRSGWITDAAYIGSYLGDWVGNKGMFDSAVSIENIHE